MNKFNREYLKNIKKRVGEGTGIQFEASGGSWLETVNPVIVTLLVIALGSATVFAAHQFRMSKSVLETPTVDTASAQQIEDSGIYDQNGSEYGTVNGFIISFPFGSKEGVYGTIHHDGIDLAADKGTAVLAAAEGTVTDAEFDSKMGNYVVIDHGNGYTTTYAHLQDMTVDIGQSVNIGDQIGTVGATGMATGPCLHLELRLNGEPLDPEDYWE